MTKYEFSDAFKQQNSVKAIILQLKTKQNSEFKKRRS